MFILRQVSLIICKITINIAFINLMPEDRKVLKPGRLNIVKTFKFSIKLPQNEVIISPGRISTFC